QHARQVGVTTFVTAAAQARARGQYDEATALLTTAKSFDEHAPEIVSESVAIDRDRGSTTAQRAGTPAQATVSTPQATATATQPGVTAAPPAGKSQDLNSEEKRASFEIIKEQFETQVAAGDTAGAGKSARVLSQAAPASVYVARDVPRLLALSYVHL